MNGILYFVSFEEGITLLYASTAAILVDDLVSLE